MRLLKISEAGHTVRVPFQNLLFRTMLACPKIGPQYAIKRNDLAIQSNNSFWLFYSWRAEYLGRKKTCSMTCGAIVDKGCNVAQSVIQSCHQSSMFRENGRETLPFHKYKAFVYDDCASHEAFFFLLPKMSMPYYISVQTWTPFTNIRNIFTQCFVFSRLQMNVSFGTRAYCRN